MKTSIKLILLLALMISNTSNASFEVLKYRDNIGKYHNLVTLNNISTDSEEIIVVNKPLATAVANGEVDGTSVSVKFGSIITVDTADPPVDIWSLGQSIPLMAEKTNGVVMSIASSSIEDAVGGAGCSTLFISGIDANWDLASEIVTLTGTTPALTTNSYIAINRMYIKACGSDTTNTGNISATHTGDVISYIMSGVGQTEQTNLTTPRNSITQVIGPFVGIVKSGTGRTLSARIMSREYQEGWRHRSYGECTSSGTSYIQTPSGDVPLFTVGGRARIKMRVYDVSTNGTGVIAGYAFLTVLFF